MAIAITIPRLGWNMERGRLRRLAQARRRGHPRGRSALHPRGREGDPGHRGDRRRDPPHPRHGPGRPATIVAVGTVIGYLLAPGRVAGDRVEPSEADVRTSRDPAAEATVCRGSTPAARQPPRLRPPRDRPRSLSAGAAAGARAGRRLDAARRQRLHGSNPQGRRPRRRLGTRRSSPRPRGTAARGEIRPDRSRPAGRSPRGWSRAVRRRRR